MPTYIYECKHPSCVGEFEEFHSITIKLENCPRCQEAGRGEQSVQRLIAGGSGRGIVELSANEMKEALPGEIAKIHRRAARDENFLANLVGEKKYNNRGR